MKNLPLTLEEKKQKLHNPGMSDEQIAEKKLNQFKEMGEFRHTNHYQYRLDRASMIADSLYADEIAVGHNVR